MKRFSVLMVLFVVVFLTAGIANGKCLQVEVDKDLGISGTCWDLNGKNYNLTFEFVPGEETVSGKPYWKLKTLVEATDCQCPPAPISKTGQDYAYVTGGDGDLQMGVPWPNPRFTDNKDGTVTDNLTGLIWLKDVSCFAANIWSNAVANVNTLKSGECGLSDGSASGDWRLPNRKEAMSLCNVNFIYPSLSNTAGTGQMNDGDPFTNVELDFGYWTSTTYDAGSGDNSDSAEAWYVHFGVGHTGPSSKLDDRGQIWPVRGGVKGP